MAGEMLTAKELQQEVFEGRVSVGWLYLQVREGKMPCFKAGRRVLFRRSTVLAWLEEQEQVLKND